MALFSSDTANDPYPLYAQMRREAPVHRLERYGWWAVSRHEDVTTVMKRHDLFSSDTGLDRMRPPFLDDRAWEALEILRGRSLINSDPPIHTRLRRLISAAFTPRAMAELERRLQQITGALIDRLVTRDTFDVVTDLAIPMPVTVIAEMLGIDSSRSADFKRWSDDLLELSRLTREQRMTPEQTRHLVKSRFELLDYLQLDAARAGVPDDVPREFRDDQRDLLRGQPREALGRRLPLGRLPGDEHVGLDANSIAVGSHPPQISRLAPVWACLNGQIRLPPGPGTSDPDMSGGPGTSGGPDVGPGDSWRDELWLRDLY